MNKLDLTKTVVSFVVGSGATKIITSIVKNNVQPENVTETVTVFAGGTVLGMMVADVSKKYTDTKIEEVASWWRENVRKD
jgi:hypothetical protein